MKSYRFIAALAAAVFLSAAALTSVSAAGLPADAPAAHMQSGHHHMKMKEGVNPWQTQVLAGITGRTAEDISNECKTNKTTLGQIAINAGVLDKYKAGLIAMYTDKINQKVSMDGKLTQDKADQMIASMTAAINGWNGTTPLRLFGEKKG